ncbi:MAG: response regulator transcription factor [Endomicrobium sp.]|jgi:DNA-binding response OmpR family regulator|nr:response regulator transcription factor [Endomicrobium sp.]
MKEIKIIVIDDEESLRTLVKQLLEYEGFMVIACKDTDEGYSRMLISKPDIIIVDINMPTIGGMEFVKKVRRDPILRNTLIIMLTVEFAEANKIGSFDSGADDYLTKPFSNRELIARVKALLRRVRRKNRGDKFEVDGLVLSLKSKTVLLKGKTVHLRPKEFDLLYLFLRNPDIVLDRELILENVFEYNISASTRTIDTHIKNLRNTLKTWGERHIKTVFGVGFKFNSNKK